jgi:hypothetical protein
VRQREEVATAGYNDLDWPAAKRENMVIVAMNGEDGNTGERLRLPASDCNTGPTEELGRSALKHLDEKLFMGGFVCSEDSCNIWSNDMHETKSSRGHRSRQCCKATKVCRNFTSNRSTANQDQCIWPQIPSHFIDDHSSK